MPHPTCFFKATRPRRGFTLVELLTVVAIIAILMSILIPTVGLMMVRARQTKSSANLSSIGKALSLYTLDNYGLLPAPTFGTSTAPASSPGSSNPRGGPWLEELVGQKYLGGTFTTNLGSSTGTVDDWPSVLTCPQYVSEHSVISDPDVRGYGMNIFPYRADKDSPNFSKSYPTQRLKLESLPNHGNNIVIGTSNDVTMEPGEDGTFEKDGTVYKNGDPARFTDRGLFLFLDNSVEALNADEVAKVLNPQ